jgi:hypothetical protein
MSNNTYFVNPKDVLLYVLGFLIPIPLFIDLEKFALVLIVYDILTPIAISAGKPVPIALFLIPVFFLLKIKKADITNYIAVTLLLCIINFNLINKLDYIRFISLLIIPLFFYISYNLSNTNYFSFSRGYFMGLLFFTSLHFISFIFNLLDSASFIDNLKYGGRNFFGLEIYQFWISFSAVISFLAVTLIFLYFMNVKKRRSLLPLIFLCFFELALTLRKAAILDLFICFVFIFIFIIFSRKKSTFNFKNLTLILFFCYGFYSIFNLVFLSRGITIESSVSQRDGAYLTFFNILSNIDLNSVLFGYKTGWGGYSNLFVEVFLRTGLIGFIPFILSTFYFIRIFLINCTTIIHVNTKYKGLMKYYLFFIIISFLVSNVVNMNFILPYYTLNIICIILYYKYKLTTSL